MLAGRPAIGSVSTMLVPAITFLHTVTGSFTAPAAKALFFAQAMAMLSGTLSSTNRLALFLTDFQGHWNSSLLTASQYLAANEEPANESRG